MFVTRKTFTNEKPFHRERGRAKYRYIAIGISLFPRQAEDASPFQPVTRHLLSLDHSFIIIAYGKRLVKGFGKVFGRIFVGVQ
jgi:hypothetical protein